jgi:hypothetical protein
VKSCISALSVWFEVPLSQGLFSPPLSVLDGGRDSLKNGSLFCTDMAFHLRRLHYSWMIITKLIHSVAPLVILWHCKVMHHVTYRLYPVDTTRIDGVDDMSQPRQHKKVD